MSEEERRTKMKRQDRGAPKDDLIGKQDGVEDANGHLPSERVGAGRQRWIVRRHLRRVRPELVESQLLAEPDRGGDVGQELLDTAVCMREALAAI
jgi:hypothetical protein